MNLKERAKEVLAQSHLMTLAVHDAEGVWAADVIFVYDEELRLYWISDPGTRHARAVDISGEAAATITASRQSKEPNFGLQIAGRVQKLHGTQYALVAKHFAKRGHETPPEENDNDRMFENLVWYELQPTTIHLIDEANFGFDKQVVR